MEKIKVGQVVYNKADAGEHTVTKVGNKYFEVTGSRYRFEIATLASDRNSFRQTFLSLDKQSVLDTIEFDKLYRTIGGKFRDWTGTKNFNLEQLRKINEILNTQPTTNNK